MSFSRVVEPELLDVLPPAEPRAIRSRRDLQRVNRLMRNDALLAKMLRGANVSSPSVLADLGAGDGVQTLRLAQRMAVQWPKVRVFLVDRLPIVTADTFKAFETLGWQAEAVQADVIQWLRDQADDSIDVITANLFLHHFKEAPLFDLLSQAVRISRVFVANEPHRSWLAWQGSRLLGLLGCNDVTRHDAAASVRAGFVGQELTQLWPAESWYLQERYLPPFSHGLLAMRQGVEVHDVCQS